MLHIGRKTLDWNTCDIWKGPRGVTLIAFPRRNELTAREGSRAAYALRWHRMGRGALPQPALADGAALRGHDVGYV